MNGNIDYATVINGRRPFGYISRASPFPTKKARRLPCVWFPSLAKSQQRCWKCNNTWSMYHDLRLPRMAREERAAIGYIDFHSSKDDEKDDDE